ncbi:acyl-CoA thioesterase II [Prauserella rugosa]|uniref:Acyl-CoA thioesterase 2 n=1 Tax=Prauserella rugosa TaxID=43354 RepID=A0A660CDN3_9PSEU|nr:acyl-CoA thioesterase II [Prauserella rugosa]KMS82789.1 acyl-CoA thioesterase [Streptomyces regensis]TWH18995.1 acyl-CoA thioesterase-2 [Prauserella rugosa]
MTELARAAAAAADGAATGQPVLDQLVNLLDLEKIEENIFRGVSPPHSPTRVFGGQVAGQALVAAGRTVPAERHVHSLHAYFIRGGDPTVPIVYEVDRIRDGRSFTTRRVTAVQHGKAIFALSASFQKAEAGIEHSGPMPEVPDPEGLPTLAERIEPYADTLTMRTGPRPLDMRYVNDPPWVTRQTGDWQGRNQVWMKADGVLPDDPLLHVCVLTYASDLTLLDSVLAEHDVYWEFDQVLGASLDHALWFHRPFRADNWFLYDSTSPTASGARGLATGQFFAHDGSHIATVVQEGLVRVL